MNVTLLQYLRMKIHFFSKEKEKKRKEKDNYEPSKRKGRKWPTRSFLGP
jgi:hypothetical protein